MEEEKIIFNHRSLCEQNMPESRNILFFNWIEFLEPCFKAYVEKYKLKKDPYVNICDYYWILEQYYEFMMRSGPDYIEIMNRFYFNHINKIKVSIYFVRTENAKGYFVHTDNTGSEYVLFEPSGEEIILISFEEALQELTKD